MTKQNVTILQCQEMDDIEAWDRMLAGLNGHPLQSARWGEARKHVDGLESCYLTCKQSGNPLFLVRVETRKLPLLGKVAWIPRGPTLAPGVSYIDLADPFHGYLRQQGFSLVITDRYAQNLEVSSDSGIRTIWIDLTLGLDLLRKRIDKQWMYGRLPVRVLKSLALHLMVISVSFIECV